MTDPWKEVQSIMKNIAGTSSKPRHGGAICDYCGKEMIDPHTRTCTKPYIILKGRLYKRDTTKYDWGDRCHDCGIENKFGNLHHPGCDVEQCPRCGGQAAFCECNDDTTQIVGKEYVGRIPMGKSVKPRYTPKKKQHGSPLGRKVLELGPGDSPDSRTTHSIDDTPNVEMARYSMKHNPAFKGVKHTFAVDFNKNRLPFPNNSFDLIISHGVISAKGFVDRPDIGYTQGRKSIYPLQPAFYKELLRILKQGGTLEMWAYWKISKAVEKEQVRLLTSFGFKSVRFGTGTTEGEKGHITYAKK